MRYEGSAASKLRNLIKNIGANTDIRLEFGTVTVAAPALRVLVDGMKIELDADDLVVPRNLTDHAVTFRRADSSTEVVTVESRLLVGDRVIVAQINDGQTYVILDRF